MANETNARRVWDFLKSELGLDDLRAAAIMGNFSQESGFNTGAISYDGEGSLGIGQWTYDRRTALEALGDPTNLETQLRHLANELAPGGARRWAWENLLASSGSLADLTSIWCDDFEAPDPAAANKQHRFDEAQRYLSMFGGGGTQAFTGSLMNMLAPLHAEASNYTMYGDLNPASVDYDDGYDDAVEDIGTAQAFAQNLWDSVTDTGFANLMQLSWGGIAHSGKWWYEQKDPITQEDITFVQQSLPDDKEAQQFILLNGRDSQEVRWLVNQKLVDKNRRAMIEKWKEQNESIIAGGLVAGAGGAGYLIDPLNLIPMGNAIKGAQMIGRLGKGLMNISKAKEVAQLAVKTGYELAKMNAPIAGVTVTNSYMRHTFGGEKVDYAYDVGAAMLAGTVLSLAGVGAGKAISSLRGRKTLTAEVAEAADNAETQVYMEAAGMDPAHIRAETINHMRTLHDPEFGQKLGSRIYDRFEKNGRVIASSYEKVRASVSRIAGIDLPKDAKAFYVPNEDYTVLITDNIKDAAHAENVLAHEFGVHASLHQSLGKKEYASLMNQVKQAMNKEGHVFNEIRRKYDTQDPEEVFAHAAEEDALPQGITAKIKGILNSALGREGYTARMTQENVKAMLEQQAFEKRHTWEGFHVNADGTTAFAGIQFSRDNLLNPQLWADWYELEPTITKDTQKDLPAFLRSIGKGAESGTFGATHFGVMLNSTSNTARKYAPQFFADPRGRGIGHVKTLTAEEQKEWVIRRLSIPYGEFIDARAAWMQANKKLPFRSAQLAFDKMVQMHYNAKYAGSKATLLADVPREVEDAVEAVRRYRELQIEIGKKSAEYFGAKADNLIESSWKEVDLELWRTVDMDARERFLAHYNTAEDAAKDLADYYHTYANRDTIKMKILREIEQKNEKIRKENRTLEHLGLPEKPLIDSDITDDMIEEWLEARIPAAVEHALKANLDTTAAGNMKELGHLSFFDTRIPMDTSGVMKFNAGTPNEFSFSFDNNLRSYDLDNIMQKNMQRFAGEIAVKNVFGTDAEMQSVLAKIKSELELSASHGDSNASAINEYNQIKEAIAELRGQKAREDVMGRLGVLARMGLNLSYAKNGANMGFSQIGEIGGAIAYGGASRIFGAIPMLRDLVADIRHGKVTTEAFREAEQYMFGRALEAEIWKTNTSDRVVRDVLTERGSLMNKGLITASELVQKLGKVTSTLNMLPKMTDSMYRDMRTGYLMDAVEWAAGKQFSKARNPFSAAKLKASHVTNAMAERIKTQLNNAVRRDGRGNVVSIDVDGWMHADPESYFKFYGMGEAQAQRAIISGMRQGNKNFLKNKNWFTRMLFQFKDYNLRAINAQTMRALTARELDDGIAFGMSIATNIAAYALRIGAKGAAMIALGNAIGAEEYYKRMFDDGQLMRVAALRSAFSAPLSFGNDVYEAYAGAPTIRTTVDRQQRRGKNQDALDNIADAIKQLPAIQTGASFKGLAAIPDLLTGDGSQRDLRNLYKALPIPNFIPFMTYIDSVIGGSGLPEKRPKK